MTEEQMQGNYLVLTAPFPMKCEECGTYSEDFLVANEVIFGKNDELGIDAIVRYSECHHQVIDVVADPVVIAIMTEFFEAAEEDDDG